MSDPGTPPTQEITLFALRPQRTSPATTNNDEALFFGFSGRTCVQFRVFFAVISNSPHKVAQDRQILGATGLGVQCKGRSWHILDVPLAVGHGIVPKDEECRCRQTKDN